MFEFFSNIPAMFYYGAAASAVIILIMAYLFTAVTDRGILNGVALIVFFPITVLGIGISILTMFYTIIVDILDGIREDIPFYEIENKNHLICTDNEMIIKSVSFNEGLLIYSILTEHNISVDAQPTVKWHIFPSKRRVIPNIDSDEVKLIFDSVEDKATFQFYWESLKNDN